jgi:hypothetical protein
MMNEANVCLFVFSCSDLQLKTASTLLLIFYIFKNQFLLK